MVGLFQADVVEGSRHIVPKGLPVAPVVFYQFISGNARFPINEFTQDLSLTSGEFSQVRLELLLEVVLKLLDVAFSLLIVQIYSV